MEPRVTSKSYRASLASLPLFEELKNLMASRSRKSSKRDKFHPQNLGQKLDSPRRSKARVRDYDGNLEGHLPTLFYYNGFQPEPITSTVRSMLEVELELEETEKARLRVLGAEYFKPIGFHKGKKLFASQFNSSNEKSGPYGIRSNSGIHRLQEAIGQEWREVGVSRYVSSNNSNNNISNSNTANYLRAAIGPGTYHNPLRFRLHEESQEMEDELDELGEVLGQQGTETGEIECTFDERATLGYVESEPDMPESLDDFLDGLEDVSAVETSLRD